MGAPRPDPADYMLRVARTASAVAYKAHVVAELGLRPGHVVLDVGCGPGIDLPGERDAVGPSGLTVGIDLDRKMLTEARKRVPQTVGLLAGDAHRLPVQSASADRIRTDRALQHMRDPRSVLEEFRRVLRPGGLAVIAEPDRGTLVVDSDRPDVGDAFVAYTCCEVVRNAFMGREVARLGRAAGFVTSNLVAFPTVVRDFAAADKIFGLTRNAGAAVDAGYLARDDADAWLGELAMDPVLVSVTLFVTTLRRPRDDGNL